MTKNVPNAPAVELLSWELEIAGDILAASPSRLPEKSARRDCGSRDGAFRREEASGEGQDPQAGPAQAQDRQEEGRGWQTRRRAERNRGGASGGEAESAWAAYGGSTLLGTCFDTRPDTRTPRPSVSRVTGALRPEEGREGGEEGQGRERAERGRHAPLQDLPEGTSRARIVVDSGTPPDRRRRRKSVARFFLSFLSAIVFSSPRRSPPTRDPTRRRPSLCLPSLPRSCARVTPRAIPAARRARRAARTTTRRRRGSRPRRCAPSARRSANARRRRRRRRSKRTRLEKTSRRQPLHRTRPR